MEDPEPELEPTLEPLVVLWTEALDRDVAPEEVLLCDAWVATEAMDPARPMLAALPLPPLAPALALDLAPLLELEALVACVERWDGLRLGGAAAADRPLVDRPDGWRLTGAELARPMMGLTWGSIGILLDRGTPVACASSSTRDTPASPSCPAASLILSTAALRTS